MNPANREYVLSEEAQTYINAICLMPPDMRLGLLTKFHAKVGTPALIEAFSGFIGMMNQLEYNMTESVKMFAVTECGTHSHEVSGLNLPSIMGAFNGLRIAVAPTPKMCSSCAFRLGSVPNQSLCTTIDAKDCAKKAQRFMCHENMGIETGEPTKTCAGYAASLKRSRA